MREYMQDLRQRGGDAAIEPGEARCECLRVLIAFCFGQAPQPRPYALRRAPLQQHAVTLVAQNDEHDVLFRQDARRAW